MRKTIRLAGVVLLPVMAMQAQAIEFNILAGGNLWKASPSGYIQGKATESPLDVKDKLGLSKENQNYFFVQLDHPIPVIPNLRVSRTALDFTGNNTTAFKFLDQDFSGDLHTKVDLSHTDVTAYYRFLDGITTFIPFINLRAELGLTVRQFDGEFEVEGKTATSGGKSVTESISLSAPLPMGYAGLRLGLPLGLSIGANINAISYSGNRVSDATADLRYQYDGFPLIKPGLTAGYRSFDVKLDDLKDTYGDLSFSGAFFGAYLRVGF
ncbi:MAG: TIGR04219 family outer membrane beta-barrel protein [Pseudomonadaceae bacterium]|nr:TIGR04219 family outer membrane beta-barrel protein [Pseudomonadaceae bacterium]